VANSDVRRENWNGIGEAEAGAGAGQHLARGDMIESSCVAQAEVVLGEVE
jgi:hypothetical protein